MSERQFMKRRWIITGANGYLGGELCKGLDLRGENVLGVIRSGRQLIDQKVTGKSCYTYEKLAATLLPSDILVHCAGKTGSEGTWEEFLRINVEWPLQLFDQAVEKGVTCFIYVSSVAALGYRNRTDDNPLKEDAEPRLAPGELYGRSKLLAEQALQNRAKEEKIRLVILRPGLIYGHRWLGKKQTWLRRGVLVDPYLRVPLVHVDNFLDALYLAASKTEAAGIYFVVDDEQPPLWELNRKKIVLGLMRFQPWRIGVSGFLVLNAVRMFVRVIRGQFRALPNGYSMAQFYFQTRRLLYSTEKLSTCVGWQPSIKLKDGLAECIGQEITTQNYLPLVKNA
ncbi:NAD-dependent epimerase/dehydratase family protein [Desulfoprunum benzoelyticum]|uniref:Nucleoside-diphosphate-sugar epimerase n=1 Tax=Desulfoprunum benzoelyticum TaxID=1506996 RepID=A0A840V4R2_9BACT|nr:NAD-dependent epimerase/dehydratase family protein [Desulfoprunum benzoelyticum]MBB5348081.1 nucleoside-diphosphate-sugar epimerase [Desulfoprunum benzoelyticum]MBM9531595.1 NAD-dependent epimerase/dehydratase family protein [Desulfoprunum benzoelyticum]